MWGCVDGHGVESDSDDSDNPADNSTQTLRVVPDMATIFAGQSLQLAVDPLIPVTWNLTDGPGKLSADGLFMAPAALGTSERVTRIVATAVADTSRKAAVLITIVDPAFVADTSVCYTRDVVPLISSNCTMSGCHDGSDDEARALTSYAGIMQYVRNGSNGKPSATRSKLYTVLRESGDDRMPRDRAPLSDAQVELIRRWIDEGARNNDCQPLTCDTSAVTYADVSLILTRNCTGGCHSGSVPSGRIDLTNEAVVRSQCRYGYGTLVESIEHQAGFAPMPKNAPKLSECDIAKIRSWARGL
jgi:hypothetical protein